MSKRYREKYAERVGDPDILNLEADIALIDARILDLVEQLEGGAPGSIFYELMSEVESFEVLNARISRLRANDPKRAALMGRNTLKGEKMVAILVMMRKNLAPSENSRILLLDPFPLGGASIGIYFKLKPDLR